MASEMARGLAVIAATISLSQEHHDQALDDTIRARQITDLAGRLLPFIAEKG